MSDPELSNQQSNQQSDAERPQELPSGFSPGYGDPSADPYDHAVPPGYDWPTHGGYLGCLLGLFAACPLAFVAGTFIPPLARYNGVPGIIVGLLTIVIFVAIVFALGRLGFVLGKRFFREYPQPTRKTWGEDDDYVNPVLTEIAATDAATDAEQAPSGEDGIEHEAYLRDS